MTAAVEPKHRTTELRGLSLHSLEWGNEAAPPLVLLHGLTSAAAAWRRVAVHFAGAYRVIALDQRGHGDSSWAPEGAGAYATDTYVGDLEAWVDALSLDRFALVGHSMGGHHTIAYTARHPERVVCVVANDIPPRYDRHEASAEQYPDGRHRLYPTVEAWIDEQRTGSVFTPEHMHQLNAEAKLKPVEGGVVPRHDPRASLEWEPKDLWDEARGITRPILFLRGGRSDVLDAQTLQDMDLQIDPARSITLEKSGHATFYDMEHEFLAVVADFIAAHSRD
jgi:pimeloyl-ACP methyl ester carboxylesterase